MVNVFDLCFTLVLVLYCCVNLLIIIKLFKPILTKENILKNVGVQTTLNPIEFYCMLQKCNSLRHWKYHFLNTNNIGPHWISLYGHKNIPNFFLCVPLKNESHTGLEQHMNESIFGQLIWCVCEGNLYSLFSDWTKYPHIRNTLNVYPDYDS